MRTIAFLTTLLLVSAGYPARAAEDDKPSVKKGKGKSKGKGRKAKVAAKEAEEPQPAAEAQAAAPVAPGRAMRCTASGTQDTCEAIRSIGTFAALSALAETGEGRVLAMRSCRRVVDLTSDVRSVIRGRLAAVQVGANDQEIGSSGPEVVTLDAEIANYEQFCLALAQPGTDIAIEAAAHVIEVPTYGRVTLGQALDSYRTGFDDRRVAEVTVPTGQPRPSPARPGTPRPTPRPAPAPAAPSPARPAPPQPPSQPPQKADAPPPRPATPVAERTASTP